LLLQLVTSVRITDSANGSVLGAEPSQIPALSTEARMMEFPIAVSTLSGDTFQLDLGRHDRWQTVRWLKRVVEVRSQIPYLCQIYLFNGVVLHDSEILFNLCSWHIVGNELPIVPLSITLYLSLGPLYPLLCSGEYSPCAEATACLKKFAHRDHERVVEEFIKAMEKGGSAGVSVKLCEDFPHVVRKCDDDVSGAIIDALHRWVRSPNQRVPYMIVPALLQGLRQAAPKGHTSAVGAVCHMITAWALGNDFNSWWMAIALETLCQVAPCGDERVIAALNIVLGLLPRAEPFWKLLLHHLVLDCAAQVAGETAVSMLSDAVAGRNVWTKRRAVQGLAHAARIGDSHAEAALQNSKFRDTWHNSQQHNSNAAWSGVQPPLFRHVPHQSTLHSRCCSSQAQPLSPRAEIHAEDANMDDPQRWKERRRRQYASQFFSQARRAHRTALKSAALQHREPRAHSHRQRRCNDPRRRARDVKSRIHRELALDAGPQLWKSEAILIESFLVPHDGYCRSWTADSESEESELDCWEKLWSLEVWRAEDMYGRCFRQDVWSYVATQRC